MTDEIEKLRETNEYLRNQYRQTCEISSEHLRMYHEKKDEVEKLRAENDEWKALHTKLNQHCFPGEVDSSDSARKVIRDLEAELERVKQELADVRANKDGWQRKCEELHKSQRELSKAAKRYLNNQPVDGWHFEVCSFTDDDEAGCNCGVGEDEIALREAIRKLDQGGEVGG